MKYNLTLENIQGISKELRNFFKVGYIMSINGSMGAGKTTLLKEILYEYPVGSPSFLQALTYGDKFLHVDAYMLTQEKFLALAIEDSLVDKCVIIEWGNLIDNIIMKFPNPKVVLNIEHMKNDRRILSYFIKDGEEK